MIAGRGKAALAGGLVVVVGVLAAALTLGLPADDQEPQSQQPTAGDASGEEALTIPFEHFDGRVARLADWEGAPLVVNFWASWCPPCVAEMADALEPAHAELEGEVAFVGLNLQDDPGAADAVVERTGVTYELGRDPDGELFAAFGGFGMPTTVFIDEDGTVVATHSGAVSRSQLDQLIAQHLGVDGVD